MQVALAGPLPGPSVNTVGAPVVLLVERLFTVEDDCTNPSGSGDYDEGSSCSLEGMGLTMDVL
ncbi:hypothetical protein PsYK624_096680 [Phanerochaete sordida]|uniref:Uncharacterized protein n=1 Tax=Phanerochaete sordida TaxID=48140 RepID=A0A9P3GFS7_9APHY|nr:hypothetical protein PsYK624_096680 [Phanerochaete sordida]